MSNEVENFMPVWIADYLADTTHLTTLQHGAYDLLLFAYWRRGGPLPDDNARLAAITKSSPAQWRTLRPTLVEFFTVKDGLWHQKRAEEELEKARANLEASRRRTEAATKARTKLTKPVTSDATDDVTKTVTVNVTSTTPPPPSPEEAKASSQVEGRAAPPPPRGSRLPRDWSPSEADSVFAAELGLGPAAIVRISEKFRDYWIAKAGAGGVKLDWSATWRIWVRREVDDGHGNNSGQHGRPARSGRTQRDIQLAAALGSCRDEGGGAALRDADHRERGDDPRGEGLPARVA